LVNISPCLFQNATAKVDAIIAENPGKSLDELVAESKINADQKAQALKKPSIQAAITHAEEQLAHYNELAAIYEQRLSSQKAELEEAHKQEVESLQEKAAAAEVPESPKEDIGQQLLVLSKFLFTIAHLRHAGEGTSPESRAFEGVLFQVYGGSLDAVASMKKLIDGADEKISSIEGETLDVTCKFPGSSHRFRNIDLFSQIQRSSSSLKRPLRSRNRLQKLPQQPILPPRTPPPPSSMTRLM
jgi:hypothetical protein